MKVPFKWLKEYVDIDLQPAELARKITLAGFETLATPVGKGNWTNVFVGQITAVNPHPNADRLHLPTVELGTEKQSVVCGAPNLKVGDKIDASLFKQGDRVDVVGISKGKGFAGVVKRHHFSGGPKTHGQSDRTRHPGSIGSTTYPGRVFKGLRMAGRMGGEQVTVKSLEVYQADPQRNLLLVRGAVPGNRNGLLLIKKSSKGNG